MKVYLIQERMKYTPLRKYCFWKATKTKIIQFRNNLSANRSSKSLVSSHKERIVSEDENEESETTSNQPIKLFDSK